MSLSAARATVSKFFTDTTADEVAADRIFSLYDRPADQPEQNKTWLTNKLTHLKHYDLVTSVYSEGRPRRLVGVRLTQQGRQVLGRGNPASQTTGAPQVVADITAVHVSLNSIAQDIIRFEQQNPNIELELSVKIRKREETIDNGVIIAA